MIDHRHWLRFGLFEAGADALPVIDRFAGGIVEASTELGKVLLLLELRVLELKIAGDRAVSSQLRRSANAGDRLADIDRGKNP